VVTAVRDLDQAGAVHENGRRVIQLGIRRRPIITGKTIGARSGDRCQASVRRNRLNPVAFGEEEIANTVDKESGR
jgi:hypothetical protein